MSLSSEERYYVKLKASYLYYKENKTQAEIAELFNISRPTLIKLLNDAKKEGIVTIEVHDTRMGSHHIELEQTLRKKLGLKDVKIVSASGTSKEAVNLSVGAAAEQYLTNLLRSGMTVGLGWGRTLEIMARYIKPHPSIVDLHIVSLLGGLGSTSAGDYSMFANSLCEIMASNYSSASVSMMYSPLVAPNEVVAQTFTDTLADTYEKQRALDIAIVGIDSDPAHSTTLEIEKPLQALADEIRDKKIVGNVCSRFYNKKGELCPLSIESNILAISTDDLRNTPVVIGAAGGENKVDSIIGGARAKLFNILVTDEHTARSIALGR
ncbi:MAG: sugar-binding domain-containing protein [Christensenella sp.]|uniref:sugar-binding transcriptional regulator n=1 Tax=Christensenella sp. TaxID=1935934 RepID=UPI002B1F78AA|nr:sugar-binding domain-containing protein [Christensenella sp.]MEA5004453.1 sugar-binding domain-containing protein [Christensenella sp.]